MKTTNRGKQTGPEPEPEPEISEPLTDSVPEDLAAAAVADRQAARDADEEAARLHGEAASVVAAARAEADRIVSEGQAKALPLVADARALERKAAELGGRSKHMEHAARQEALAEQSEAQAEDLAADLERVTGTIAGLDARLAALGADRERREAEHAAALSAGNVPAIAEAAALIKATDEAVAALTAQDLAPAQALARQLGDGTETGPGLLLDALTAVRVHRQALRKALNELYPSRPEAGMDDALATIAVWTEALSETQRHPGLAGTR